MPGPQPRPSIASVPVYQPGKPIAEVSRELGLSRVVKLASNENPLGPSRLALAAARRALVQVNLYPEGGAPLLRAALARRFRLSPEHFVFGNGSNEVLIFAAQAFSGPGRRAAFSKRSFAVYEIAARLAGAAPLAVPSPDHTHDLAGLLKAARRAAVVYLCNPNNPTGSWHPPAAIEAFLRRAPSRTLVVLDEAYAEYAGQTEAREARWVRRFPNLLIARTFSKVYGLAGLRLGYGLAQPTVIRALEACRQPFNVNLVAQAAALAALSDKGFVRRTLRVNRAGLEQLSGGLEALGLDCLPSKANFLLFREPGYPAPRGLSWYAFLLRGGVIVRPIERGWLRVTTGLPAQNAAFLKRLSQGMREAA